MPQAWRNHYNGNSLEVLPECNFISFTKLVLAAGLFYCMVCVPLIYCVFTTFGKYVVSFPECSVWHQAWCVRVRCLSRKHVSSSGGACAVWHALFEAQPLFSAEHRQKRFSFPGMCSSYHHCSHEAPHHQLNLAKNSFFPRNSNYIIMAKMAGLMAKVFTASGKKSLLDVAEKHEISRD